MIWAVTVEASGSCRGYEIYFKTMVTKAYYTFKILSMKRGGVIGHSCHSCLTKGQLTKWPPLKKSCLLHTSFLKTQSQLNILKSQL